MTYSSTLQATFDVGSRRMTIQFPEISEGAYRVWADLQLIGDFSATDLKAGFSFSALYNTNTPHLVRLEGLDSPNIFEGRVWLSEDSAPLPVNHNLWTAAESGKSICVMISANRIKRFFHWFQTLQPFVKDHLNIFLLLLEDKEGETRLSPRPIFELTRQMTVLSDPAAPRDTANRIDAVFRRFPAVLCIPLCRESAQAAAYLQQTPVLSLFFQAEKLDVVNSYALTLVPRADHPLLQTSQGGLSISFNRRDTSQCQGVVALCRHWFNLPNSEDGRLPAPAIADLLARAQETANTKTLTVLGNDKAQLALPSPQDPAHMRGVPFRYWLAQQAFTGQHIKKDITPDLLAESCVVFAGTDPHLDRFLDQILAHLGGNYLSSCHQRIS
ncbi:hypothetical protein KMP13_11580 [Epibacterium ulvae]|uniref:hypothetical protein n=1 Tax=Epibacterium ulvae TaxID=1156985 RepID=UPI001BFC182A|nr:hypothetical protein [Epibacterium ulvae]MBT8154527.1 hypothetical protein [Epibacterium ulvae]